MLVIAFGIVLVVSLIALRRDLPVASPPAGGLTPGKKVEGQTEPVRASELYSQRRELDRTVWAAEERAQGYEDRFVALWDALRNQTNRAALLKDFPVDRIGIPVGSVAGRRPFEIQTRVFGAPEKVISRAEFGEMIDLFRDAGMELVQSEWHHSEFVPGQEGMPDRSTVSMTLHVRASKGSERYILLGRLGITWAERRDRNGLPEAARIDLNDLTLATRQGAPAFVEAHLPGSINGEALPILSVDLDGDGLVEVVLPRENIVYRNKGGMDFKVEPLTTVGIDGTVKGNQDEKQLWTGAVMSDFSGDGWPDLLMAVPYEGVFLYENDGKGSFNGQPAKVFEAAEHFRKISAITSGDVNGDGREDVWIGQYRLPFVKGGIPVPFLDANNGNPSFLLINQGGGKFVEATVSAGLGAKRFRRNYSASMVDLDNDGDLDLLTVNDFSGVDLFTNDGHGVFTDVTARAVDERSLFGMGHAFGDFNNDSKLDFFVTGMSSTTARRLEALGLGRKDFPELDASRMKMAYGNRMYLGNGAGRFQEPDFKDQVARSGWSWGVTAFDFGNDGNSDLYVANGNVSGESCKDYCTRFWRHDIYVNPVLPASALEQLTGIEIENYRQGSWNGFEKNHLFLNLGGAGFENVAFLFDIAHQGDGRSVLSEDFDNDGRVDLLFVESPSVKWRTAMPIIRLLRNTWEPNGNWIGVRVRADATQSGNGALIRVTTGDRRRVAVVVNGDSHWCQHSQTRHFGLGAVSQVDSIEVVWPNGSPSTVIRHPAINRYHSIGREGVR